MLPGDVGKDQRYRQNEPELNKTALSCLEIFSGHSETDFGRKVVDLYVVVLFDLFSLGRGFKMELHHL